MKIRFQADNDFNQKVIDAILLRESAIDFQTAPAIGLHLGVPDDQVLAIATKEGRIVVSHDKKTMPTHFADFIASQSSPGLFIVSRKLTIAQTADWLILYWAATKADEHFNLITYIP
ncbi:MAG: DUF5615 family PIN-like protein [Acidobacteriota bacterium]